MDRLPALVAAVLLPATPPLLLDIALSPAIVLMIPNQLLAQTQNEEYAQFHLSRSVTRKEAGDYQGAMSDLNTAIQAGGDAIRHFAYINRGDLRYMLGDSHGAISDYNQAIALGGNFGVNYRRRGVAKAAIGDYQGAIADYNIAVEILSPPKQTSPDLVIEVLILRGNALGKIGATQGACDDYKKAVSYGDQSTLGWLWSDDGAWCRNMP